MSRTPNSDRLLVKNIKDRFEVFCNSNECITCRYEHLPCDSECICQWVIDLLDGNIKQQEVKI